MDNYVDGSINNIQNNGVLEYSNIEMDAIFKADVKALLGFLKAKVSNSKDLDKARKFAYNRGLLDDKDFPTKKAMDILGVLFELFPGIAFTNSDVIKSIDINEIIEKIDQIIANNGQFTNGIPTDTNGQLGDDNNTNGQLGIPTDTNGQLVGVGNTNDKTVCLLFNNYEKIKEDIRKVANELRKSKGDRNTFGTKSFYDLVGWLLSDGCVDTRYIAENIKNLNASLGSYKSDISALKKIEWIYEDLDGLYKLNTDKFLSDLERAGLLKKIEHEEKLSTKDYDNETRDKLIETYEKLVKGYYVDDNGVFKFEFGDETLEQY